MLPSEILDYAKIAILSKRRVETLTAAKTLSARDSGTTYVLDSTTEFAVTLPAVEVGLWFKFIIGGAPSGASYTVVSNGGTDNIHGTLTSKDLNAASDADVTAGTAADTITFVDGKSAKGDHVEVVCDGTYWYAQAVTGGNFDAITYDAS